MYKKLCFLSGLLFLSGCVSEPYYTDEPIAILEKEDYMMDIPTGEPYAFETKEEKPVVVQKDEKIRSNPYNLDSLTQQLRHNLVGSGSQVRMENHQVRVRVAGKMAFGSNKTTLQYEFRETLYEIAQTLKAYSQTMVRVVGYTDNKGPVLKNKALSLIQAQTVADFLKNQGIGANRLLAEGKGPEEPLASNDTLAGRDQNYRIEIIIVNLL